MAEYTVRYAQVDDIPRIMRFIDENWKKNHILAVDRKLFEWQYINDKVNMVIGEDENLEIQAILGYIPYSNEDCKDFSLALWKAKEGTAFLGVRLLMYLLKEEPHRHIFCNGINVATSEGIYHRLGIKIGKLKQWYRLRPIDEYKIAKVVDDTIPNISQSDEISLIEIDNFKQLADIASDNMFKQKNVPFKSAGYIEKRYFNHPSYEYKVYALLAENRKSDMAVVFRVQECNGARALRIIDCIGECRLFYKISSKIDELATKITAEYTDIYETGLDDQELLQAGWILVGSNDNIIPNYFAPYTQCNVDINICMTDEDIVLFKGDGDQDRPN